MFKDRLRNATGLPTCVVLPRASVIIDNCVHPKYRDVLADYYRRAILRGGHTPHLIEEALAWHDNLRRTGRMLPETGDA